MYASFWYPHLLAILNPPVTSPPSSSPTLLLRLLNNPTRIPHRHTHLRHIPTHNTPRPNRTPPPNRHPPQNHHIPPNPTIIANHHPPRKLLRTPPTRHTRLMACRIYARIGSNHDIVADLDQRAVEDGEVVVCVEVLAHDGVDAVVDEEGGLDEGAFAARAEDVVEECEAVGGDGVEGRVRGEVVVVVVLEEFGAVAGGAEDGVEGVVAHAGNHLFVLLAPGNVVEALCDLQEGLVLLVGDAVLLALCRVGRRWGESGLDKLVGMCFGTLESHFFGAQSRN
ncbi:hypothetical protein BJ508DRAFT_137100 [Ascobolus immersus RN42]|uniref:Uncharacterized protein n=1 Tax=Ascobolus immersus RN42 TaxID=1160509 RepID=A0A3N4I5C3_ASCIM|nr:hypothetical protein BJ508DRAFT_137100 [Ascobolus immersus RN42]